MANKLLEKSILDYLDKNQNAIKSYIRFELSRQAKSLSDSEDFEDLYTNVYIKIWNRFKVESMANVNMISYCQATIRNTVQDLIKLRIATKRDVRKSIPWDPELDFAIPDQPEDYVDALVVEMFGMNINDLLCELEKTTSPLTYIEYLAIKKFIENGSLYKNGGELKKYNRPYNRAIAKLKVMYNG
jgi:hypothetical protein